MSFFNSRVSLTMVQRIFRKPTTRTWSIPGPRFGVGLAWGVGKVLCPSCVLAFPPFPFLSAFSLLCSSLFVQFSVHLPLCLSISRANSQRRPPSTNREVSSNKQVTPEMAHDRCLQTTTKRFPHPKHKPFRGWAIFFFTVERWGNENP